MAINYANLAALAERLIRENGRMLLLDYRDKYRHRLSARQLAKLVESN